MIKTEVLWGVTRLEKSLNTIASLCEELCETMEKERSALTEARDRDMENILGEKRERLQKIAAAEEERQNAANALGLALGISAHPPLSQLTEALAPDQSEPLIHLKNRLTESMKKMMTLNTGNARLIRRAQYYNRNLMELIKGPSPITYGPDGSSTANAVNLIHKRI